MNPLFRIDFSISDSLKIVRKSVLIYETIIPVLPPYASIIDTFFSIVNHYFYHDNDYITNWEVKRNDKLFSTMGDHEQTGYLHLYPDS